MRVLIVGDRNWTDKALIMSVLKALRPKPKVVLCGSGLGTDVITKEVATELGLKITEYVPNVNLYGRAAYPMCNQRMLDEGQPTLVIAFHNNIEISKNTEHMLFIAKYNKIRTKLYTTKGVVSD